jgi:hypothetical protein
LGQGSLWQGFWWTRGYVFNFTLHKLKLVLQFSIEGIADTVRQYISAQNDRSGPFITDLLSAAGHDHSKIESLAYSLLSTVVASAAPYAAALAQVVEYYLDERREKERVDIIGLNNVRSAAADATLVGYIREALRTSVCEQVAMPS